jgi:hypothetical protein
MTSIGDSTVWKPFLRKHWNMIGIFALATILLAGGSVLVFLWLVGNAQSSGLVPSSLGLWTMANLISFILYTIFWELLLIGIPLVVVGVLGWQWWKRLPSEERTEYHFPIRSRKSRGGGGGSFLFFIVFCIKVYLDGKWNVAIATWNLDYVVGSVVLILLLFAVIFGIPGAIIGIWWLRRETTRP